MSLQEADKAIRDAWIVGVIGFIISLVLTVVYISGAGLAHIAPMNVLELILLPMLTYGIYKKHVPSAVLLFVYHVVSKAWLWIDERAFIGLPIAFIFAYFLWYGVQGTLAYRKAQVVTA